MKTEIITIGDEILIGQIADTNAQFMTSELSVNGFDVHRITSVGDIEEDVVECLNEANQRADFVFITGGLGPTADDVTRKAITRYFDCQWEENQAMLERIRKFLAERGYDLTPRNREQSKTPRGSKIFINQIGTAPGIWMTHAHTHFVFMPGVPFEMRKLMKESIVPYLKQNFIKKYYLYKNIITQGIPEAYLADKLKDWQESLPANLALAYLPSPGMIKLRLSGKGDDPEPLHNILKEKVKALKDIIPDFLVHVGDESLEELVGELLVSRGQTVATAESCTGGNIASRIVSVAGSSRYFTGSVVAYSNDVKRQMLAVKGESIRKYGAVSKEVVEEMVAGVMDLYHTDYAVAVSGIAGPTGGIKDKPVGLTWIAAANRKTTTVHKYLFGSNRGVNIEKATNTALNLLRKMILHADGKICQNNLKI
ncbi:MAG: competence/damage-inducible protein A [Bacteroidota bacterium]